MSATAEQIARLRRMVAEADSTTFSNTVLAQAIERYKLLDSMGRDPYEEEDGDMVVNPDWVETYDLNAAAADIWSEKAASVAANFDFSAGGQSFQRSQAYTAMMAQARYYRSRRSARTVRQQTWPKPETVEDDLSN